MFYLNNGIYTVMLLPDLGELSPVGGRGAPHLDPPMSIYYSGKKIARYMLGKIAQCD